MAAIFFAAIPIAVIYLLISNAGLKKRVAALEAQTLASPLPEPSPLPQPSKSEKPISAGPWVSPQPEVAKAKTPAMVAASKGPPKAVVLTRQKFTALVSWLMQNWFYAVSAVSLGLAGIFLVIYGMEQGLFPPSVRVMASFAFGVALILAGEYIRRRFGDGEDSTTAYLPSTFSGAGIVTLFGAVLAARLLYGFIGPEVALVGMAFVGALALVLGWFYGPLLAAVGIIGAMVAPFIIGGSSDDPSLLLMYFAIITVTGLAIDTLRRWAWVSVISLATGFGAGTLLMIGSGESVKLYFLIYCVALVLAAIAVPVRKLVPDHSGTLLSIAVFARRKDDPWPEFPTRLAGAAVIAASGLILLGAIPTSRADLFWASVITLSILVLALLVWARNAPALVDLTVFPGFSLVVVFASGARLWAMYEHAALAPEVDVPLIASIAVGIGIVLSIAAAWRSLRGGASQLYLAVGAALIAPAVAVAIEMTWNPAQTLGGYVWALHAMVIAAVMVAMAERFARIDGSDHRERASVAVLSALACVAFGVVILFSSAALTIAIALTIVAAAWLDRKFKMPLMGLYILAGVTTVGYRLVIDPGIEWAKDAPLLEVLMSYVGAVAAFAVSYVLVRAAKRPRSEILLESAVFSSTGILISVLLFRAIVSWGGEDALMSHWALGIGATVWMALGLAQLRRLEIGGKLAMVRLGLGAAFLIMAAIQLILVVSMLNPLLNYFDTLVIGPRLLNTLIPAYLLPAGLLGFGAWWLSALPKPLRIGAAGVALGLAALWLGLTIRHFWRGAEGLELPGIEQPELYSYTVVLLAMGIGLFYQSLARPNAYLRKAGLLFIGLAVAKVFLVDIRGLGGLIRVFSLLFLGFSLAGLAWLNRWATVRITDNLDSKDE
ncbi:DUF2339 domain-containing protein [uncultured Aliiroseovarius sp.]|uniref:DUF2339 domain-containing protein n=1 Tax=uncultured Aliiroseovarius sp. TaxID=1658783 RepID=UPI002591572F|nr:DUF2339 domain-containing protein [uncultured Aliiroseovarius sp.]